MPPRVLTFLLMVPLILNVMLLLWGKVTRSADGHIEYGMIRWIRADWIASGGEIHWTYDVQFWPMATLFASSVICLAGFALAIQWFMRSMRLINRCQRCGYSMIGVGSRCPECGSASALAMKVNQVRFGRPHRSYLLGIVLMWTVPGLLLGAILILQWRFFSSIRIFGQGSEWEFERIPDIAFALLISIAAGIVSLLRFRRAVRPDKAE